MLVKQECIIYVSQYFGSKLKMDSSITNDTSSQVECRVFSSSAEFYDTCLHTIEDVITNDFFNRNELK